MAHGQGVLGESAPSVTSATRSYIVKEITCGCALFNLSFICVWLIQSDSDSWFYNITLNAAQVRGKSHKSAHFFKEAPGSSVHSLTTVILHRATPLTCSMCKCRENQPGCTAPPTETSALSDFISRPESLAALPHTLDMHPLLASGKRYWLLQSATTRLTASFPRLLEPSLHPHLHLPTHSSQELIPNTHTIPTHTHNHVDVSCLTLLFNKLFSPGFFSSFLSVCFYCVTF